MGGLLIGELARRAGVKAQTIRYYEALGVLAKPRRTTAGYRRYGPGTLSELAFVKKAQALGFSLNDVKQVLDLGRSGRTPCATVLSLAHSHLADLDQRIAQLHRLRDQLGAAVRRWQTGGAPADCVATFCGLINDAVDLGASVSSNHSTPSLRSSPRAILGDR